MGAGLVRLVYLLSGVAAVGIAVVAWRRRSTAPVAGPALAIAAVGIAWWSACTLTVSLATRPALVEAALLGVAVGPAVVVPGFYGQARSLADPLWRPGRTVRLLLVEPLVLLPVVATNHWHRQFMVVEGRVPDIGWVTWEARPLFWVHSLYCYFLATVALVVLVRALRHAPPLQRQQLGVVLVAALLPLAGASAALVPGVRDDLPDVAVLVFCLTAALDGYAIFRLGMMRLVPVARSVVLDGLGDAVFVMDGDRRIVDVNAAARRLVRAVVPGLTGSIVGRHGPSLFRQAGFERPFHAGEHRLSIGGSPRVHDVRITPLTDGHGRPTGSVVVARDISQEHNQRTALAAANEQLRQQVETIDRLRGELAEQAVRDVLTGLHNRRHLVDALDRALDAVRRDGGDLALVLLDIDHFKAVNDRYGHEAGDAVLVATARALGEDLRRGETLARHGGEEFVVLLPGCDLDGAVARAERWRARCAHVFVECRTGAVSTTISAGVATVSTAGPDAAALLRAADEALYAAKAAGRDRVVVAR